MQSTITPLSTYPLLILLQPIHGTVFKALNTVRPHPKVVRMSALGIQGHAKRESVASLMRAGKTHGMWCKIKKGVGKMMKFGRRKTAKNDEKKREAEDLELMEVPASREGSVVYPRVSKQQVLGRWQEEQIHSQDATSESESWRTRDSALTSTDSDPPVQLTLGVMLARINKAADDEEDELSSQASDPFSGFSGAYVSDEAPQLGPMRPISSFVDKLRGIINFDDDNDWSDEDDASRLSSLLSYSLSSPPPPSSDTPPSLDHTGITTSSSPAWSTPHRHIDTPTPSLRQPVLFTMKTSWSWANDDDALFKAEAGGVGIQRDGSFVNRVDALRRELAQIARNEKEGG